MCSSVEQYQNIVKLVQENVGAKNIEKHFSSNGKEKFLLPATLRLRTKSLPDGPFVKLSGRTSSQLAESSNSMFLHSVRPFPFFEAMMNLSHEEHDRLERQKRELQKAIRKGRKVSPAGMKILRQVHKESRTYSHQLFPVGDNIVEIRNNVKNTTKRVDISKKECPCQHMRVHGKPCVHLYLAWKSKHLDEADIFDHDLYSVERWKKQLPDQTYQKVDLQQVKTAAQNNPHRYQKNLQNPSIVPIRRGRRPDRQRHMSRVERAQVKKTKNHCSVCGSSDHNIRTCPEM